MRKHIILIISLVISIILFILLSIVEGKIIKTEETVNVYIARIDIKKDNEIKETSYEEIKIPISLINIDMIKVKEDLHGKYARENIHKGQIIFNQDIGNKEELKIIEADSGKERISVRIKSSENSVSYQIKPEDRVHLYFTGRNNIIKQVFPKYGLSVDNNNDENLFQTKKIINDIKILGIYDELGHDYKHSEFSKIDTIVIAVDSNMAEMINNLRNQGTFDITR